MNQIRCDNYNKRFEYYETMNNFPGGLGKEDVYCPYCGHTAFQIMTSGIIVTKNLKEQE